MPITVTVNNVETGAPAWQAVLPEPLATIGRNATCDLVLNDRERHVSRLHASIELRGGGHYLVVHSKTNPVLVEGRLCQPGSVTALHDRTVLVMHPFELTMHAERAAAQPVAPAASDDAFAWLAERQPAALDADPFNVDVRASRAQPAALQSDPFWQPAPRRPARLVDDIENSAALDAPVNLDPLALLDKSSANGYARPLDALLGSVGSATRGLVEFAARKPEREDAASAPDHVHDFNLPFNACAPPAVAQPPANPAVPALAWLDELPPPAVGAAPPAGEPCSPPAPAQEGDAPAPDAAAVEAFLRGLGCAEFQVPSGQEIEFFEKAGEIMQVAVQSLVTLLLSRAEVRRELRVEERTMVAVRANNPLKFVSSGAEALRCLFDPSAAQPGAFLPPVKAIEEACDELVAHELGMLAGTRAAVIGAIRHFDPRTIERTAAGGRGFLALQRDASLWQAYVKHHARVRADMADDLDRVFELDFLIAYSEQVQRVTKKSLSER